MTIDICALLILTFIYGKVTATYLERYLFVSRHMKQTTNYINGSISLHAGTNDGGEKLQVLLSSLSILFKYIRLLVNELANVLCFVAAEFVE